MKIWRGSGPVEFESEFGLTESVRRMRAATRRWSFSNMAQQSAVGTVSESRVSLQRVIPMIGNSFKPFFIGRFEQDRGKVILRGWFRLHLFVGRKRAWKTAAVSSSKICSSLVAG